MEDNYDPHFEVMLKYDDIPTWWFGGALAFSTIVALVCMYLAASSFPWWGLLIALVIAYVFLLFWGSMAAITGIGFVSQRCASCDPLLTLHSDHPANVPTSGRLHLTSQSRVEHVVHPIRESLF